MRIICVKAPHVNSLLSWMTCDTVGMFLLKGNKPAFVQRFFWQRSTKHLHFILSYTQSRTYSHADGVKPHCIAGAAGPSDHHHQQAKWVKCSVQGQSNRDWTEQDFEAGFSRGLGSERVSTIIEVK